MKTDKIIVYYHDQKVGTLGLIKNTQQVAFQYETVALHEVLKQNIIEAKHALQKAIDLFKELPSYQNIPIHNLNILDKSDKCYKFEYWFGGRLKKDVYYIDSRCSW